LELSVLNEQEEPIRKQKELRKNQLIFSS
jgi:hypothetical protein